MKKVLLVILSIILFVCSCSHVDEASSILRIAVSSEPPTLDVAVNTSLISRIIAVGNIYEKLVVLDQDGAICPELSESYELSDDGKKLSFKIRKGVSFHDGSIMTAKDVAASLNRWLDRYGVADSFVGNSRFSIVDDETVAIESDKSLSMFPYLIASAPQSAVIMPERIISSLEKGKLVNEFVGTGPYRFEEWKSGESITLSRFEDYKPYSDESNGIWGRKKANIDKLVYLFVSDSTTRRLGLESGEYDFINDLMSDDRESIQKNPKLEILEGGESGMIALVFNKKTGVSSNLDFRKAVSFSLDSDSLLKACYGDYGYFVHSDYMEKEQYFWSVPDINPYCCRDIEKAKEYLIKSGYSGQNVRILTSNLSNLDKIALAMVSELKDVGIKAEVISVDWASMIERRKDFDGWDIYISAFSQVPIPQLKSFLSPSFPGWFSDEEILDQIERMNNASSLDAAVSAWSDIQAMLWEYVPAIVPGHYSTAYAVNKKLSGVINQNGFFFWNASIEE